MTTDTGKTARRFAFILRNPLYVRNFEWPIRELAEAGHSTTILTGDSAEGNEEARLQIERLRHDLGDRLAVDSVSDIAISWNRIGTELQSARDILFYAGSHYSKAVFARQRISAKSTPVARFLFDHAVFRRQSTADFAKGLLKFAYDAIPADPAITAKLRAINPDLVIVSPLIDIRSSQIYWLKAAKHLGIPTVLAVASWDNLTNKSSIQEMPDRIFVWNEIQKREAVELHAAQADDVVVTGAQLYDHWFDRAPTHSYDEFCRQFGFDQEAPTLLYTGSSASIASDEAGFVRQWLDELRKAGNPRLRKANVLIRPHPLNQRKLSEADFSEYGNVAVHPKKGGFPVTRQAQDEYFDALCHCAAVVGINTSAIVEAAILGKHSFTIQTDQFRKTQQGTLHYHHLVDGGVLHESQSFDDHFAALAAVIEEGGDDRTLSQFVESFLRPHGLDKPATPIFLRELEKAASLPSTAPADASSLTRMPIRALLAVLDGVFGAAYGAAACFSPKRAQRRSS